MSGYPRKETSFTAILYFIHKVTEYIDPSAYLESFVSINSLKAPVSQNTWDFTILPDIIVMRRKCISFHEDEFL